jgi:aspartokinase
VDQPKLLVFDVQCDSPRLPLQIAERLERARLTFFQVSSGEAASRFAVRPLKYRDVEATVGDVLATHGTIAEINASDFALVSVVGEAVRGRLDSWRQQAERVLADSSLTVHGSAEGEISLSFLVPEEERRKAVSCLHQALVL